MYTGTASTGNSNDLKQAYNIAKMMVTKFGMSPILVPFLLVPTKRTPT
jgi:ATP-dependent Zn protease